MQFDRFSDFDVASLRVPSPLVNNFEQFAYPKLFTEVDSAQNHLTFKVCIINFSFPTDLDFDFKLSAIFKSRVYLSMHVMLKHSSV